MSRRERTADPAFNDGNPSSSVGRRFDRVGRFLLQAAGGNITLRSLSRAISYFFTQATGPPPMPARDQRSECVALVTAQFAPFFFIFARILCHLQQ